MSYIVTCTHCQANYRADPDKIPVAGKMLRCNKCKSAFGVLRPDEYYQQNYAPELAVYILARKKAQLIANLEYDLGRLAVLEAALKEQGKGFASATRGDINSFLKKRVSSDSPRHVTGMQVTIREFYAILQREKKLAANPVTPMVVAKAGPNIPMVQAHCPQCGKKQNLAANDVPIFGLCWQCEECQAPVPVMRDDDYYNNNYSTVMAAYILQRKQMNTINNLEFDMERLIEMENSFAAIGKSITGLGEDDLKLYMQRLGERFTSEQIAGIRITIADLLNTITRLGMVGKHRFDRFLGYEQARPRPAAESPQVADASSSQEGAPAVDQSKLGGFLPFKARSGLVRKRLLTFLPMTIGVAALVCGFAYVAISVRQLLPQLGAVLQQTSLQDGANNSIEKPTMTLHDAVNQGILDQVRLHIRNRTPLDTPIPPFGDTPLHLAAYQGNLAIVKLLLANGAPANIENTMGSTPLHKAAIANQSEVVEQLVAAKGDINARNSAGRTPLYEAVLLGSERMIQTLIEQGAAVQAADVNKNTPLHKAVRDHQYGVATLLLKNGARVDVVNTMEQTPMALAEEQKDNKMVQILSEYVENKGS